MMPAKLPEDKYFTVVRDLHSTRDLERLAAELSLLARPGTAILLRGEVGSGKSTFARAFIRALAPESAGFDIPSPTFTLVQTYEDTRVPVAHIDLYRTQSPAEIEELGLDGLLGNHAVVLEWPERLGQVRWPNVLTVAISGRGAERHVRMTGDGTWQVALHRNEQIKHFIESTRWKGAERAFLEGDASTRRYESLRKNSSSILLMDMPARPDGPPVCDGKPYSAVAHLAEDISAVVAINTHLCRMGYSAPNIEAFNISDGLAIVEDLGREVFGRKASQGHDMREPMKAAVALLADMAKRDWPETVPVGDGGSRRIPHYDQSAMLIEASLLPSWFWPHLHGTEASRDIHQQYSGLWSAILPLAAPTKPSWTLRDYHSPNLIWLPERVGLRRVGLIDTQDCVLGHPAYDLVSLLQDARVDIAPALTEELFAYYCDLRSGEAEFSSVEFSTAYAVLGAQRASKILGIFARLSKRDGKHGYLKHIPRVARYLEQNLQHPKLEPLKLWFETHMPTVSA